MTPENVVAAAGLCFLLINGLLLVSSVNRGRQLCQLFAERMPQKYLELGSPLPGYFNSACRAAYFRFIMQRKYEDLKDPYLVESFNRHYRSEVRQLVFLLAGFAGLGAAFVWLHWGVAN